MNQIQADGINMSIPHCSTCVYRDLSGNVEPCVSCSGSGSNYIHDSKCVCEKVEKDPGGLPLSTPGAKADANKPRVDLVFDGFALALTEVARVATFGAAKYSEHGWLQVPNGFERYTAAMDRHRLQHGLDDDSGLLHAAHLAWNALARLEIMLLEDMCHGD
jgi:hypothetical protein